MKGPSKTIYIACPWTPVGGGMFKVADYLVQCQTPHEVPLADRAQLVPLDTRGSGSAAASLFVLLGALGKLLLGRLTGRVAGVHVNMAERLSLFRKSAVVIFARAIGLPVVLHLHAAQLHHFYRGLPAPLRASVRWVFSLATRCVVLGQAAKTFVINDLKVAPDKVEIVINGVPGPVVPRAALSGSDSRKRMLFLGNLSERKGVSDLLKALTQSELAAQGQIDAVFAGGGDALGYQAKAKALGVDGFARFVGWADQQQAAQWMASSDVLVLPSYDEGLPLVILEALANGVAVICTPVGEIPHTLKDGQDAVFVTPGDTPALAAALDRVLGQEDVRRTLEKQGHALYVSGFSLEHFADSVAKVHRRCFGVSARPTKDLP